MKPIAMKCSQSEWEEIKPILKKHEVTIASMLNFTDAPYLVNNFKGMIGCVSNVEWTAENDYKRTVYEKWDKNIFLEHCGIKPKYTIKDLSEGKCAVINDGTLEELWKVLNSAFPKDYIIPTCSFRYYYIHHTHKGMWVSKDHTSLPTQSVKDFLIDEEFVLPEKWCVKVTEENKDIIDKWREGTLLKVHGYVTNTPLYNLSYGYWVREVGDYIEISFEKFKKYVLKEENMVKRFPFIVSGQDMKRLYYSISASCSWSERLFNMYGKAMLDSKDCIVIEDLYLDARRHANKTQNDLLDEIFGKDAPGYKYKDGELVLVKDLGEWLLRYTTGVIDSKGNLECYISQCKNGLKGYYIYHKPATGITLPE